MRGESSRRRSSASGSRVRTGGDQALALTAGIEGDSEHTIARGIGQSAKEKGLSLRMVSDFEAIKGRGVRAARDGQTIYVGGPRLLEILDWELPEPIWSFQDEDSAKGRSVVYLVQADQMIAGYFQTST
jgi:Cu2+-exporting ATPase